MVAQQDRIVSSNKNSCPKQEEKRVFPANHSRNWKDDKDQRNMKHIVDLFKFFPHGFILPQFAF